MEKPIHEQLLEKISRYGYKSAKSQFALVKEEEIWKILQLRIFLDIGEPKDDKILLEVKNFVLFDTWWTIKELEQFVNDLEDANAESMEKHGDDFFSEKGYKIGDYFLLFLGNFTDRKLQFHGKDESKKWLGIRYPFYQTTYSIHGDVAAKTHPEVDLTGGKIPFNNVMDALNHFWKTKYEPHSSIGNNCTFYLPIFEANIEKCEINEKKVNLKLKINKNRTSLGDLAVSIIAKGDTDNDFRGKFEIQKDELNVNLRFKPNEINVYLLYKNIKIDEYKYYDYKPTRISLVNRIRDSSIIENEDTGLLDAEIIEKLPRQIQNLLLEGEIAFNSKLYKATSIMFRSAIEEGITLLLKQIGKEKELYNDKMEVGLDRKINLVCEYLPSFKNAKSELKDIKWFGDKSVHEANMSINENDILKNIEPKLRLILAKFVKEMKKDEN